MQENFEIEVVTKEFKLVGISATDKYPESFPETADKVLTDFGGVLKQIQNAKSYDTVFCPGMCNGIIATYFACLEVEELLDQDPQDMVSFTLPETKYVKILCTNNSIMEGYEELFRWMEENNYRHRYYGACQIEIYYNFSSNGEQPAEVLIPVFLGKTVS
jgi:predicted transcriptional regulator YdeE